MTFPIENVMLPNRVLFKDTISHFDEALFTDTAARALQWTCIKEYWYYAEIGFDFEEIFIQRMLARFNIVSPKYTAVFEDISAYILGGTETYKSETATTDGNTRDYTRTRSGTDTSTDSGKDERTTTSESSGSNSGIAYARASENTRNEGSATATETATETTSYGKSTTKTASDSITDKTTDAGTGSKNESYTRTFARLTPEELSVLLDSVPVRDMFCQEFRVLFMEILS